MRYRPQSAVNCSTLRERAAGSPPNTSQLNLMAKRNARLCLNGGRSKDLRALPLLSLAVARWRRNLRRA